MKNILSKIFSIFPIWNKEVSFYAIDLGDKQNIVKSENCDIPIYPASSFKLFIFFSYAVKRADFDLNSTIRLAPFGQRGELFPMNENTFPYGLKLTLRECLKAIMRVSDNCATNTLANKIGFEEINNIIRSHGFQNSSINVTNLDGKYSHKVSMSAHDGCKLIYNIEINGYGQDVRDLAYECMGNTGHWLKNVSGIRKGGNFTMSPESPSDFVNKFCKENVQTEFAVIHNKKLQLHYVIGIQTKFRSLRLSLRDFNFANLQKRIERLLLKNK